MVRVPPLDRLHYEGHAPQRLIGPTLLNQREMLEPHRSPDALWEPCSTFLPGDWWEDLPSQRLLSNQKPFGANGLGVSVGFDLTETVTMAMDVLFSSKVAATSRGNAALPSRNRRPV